MKLSLSLWYLVLVAPIGLVFADSGRSVPARVLGTAPQPEPDRMPAGAAPRPATTRTLLPRYQNHHDLATSLRSPADAGQAEVRFLLMLPQQVCLLEARLTIDGQPFELARERRIAELLTELSKPEPNPMTGAGPAVEPPAEPPAKDTEAAAPPAASVEEATEPTTAGEAVAGDDKEPAVALLPIPSTALPARLRRYAQATGRPLTREELHWLLTNWIDGPTLLLLDEQFQRFRGAQRPAFHILDQDRDGTVSPSEVQAAAATLRTCDLNQNDVVEFTEIAEAAQDPRRPRADAAAPVLIPLRDPAVVATLYRRLARQQRAQNSDAKTTGAANWGQVDARGIASCKACPASPRQCSYRRWRRCSISLFAAFNSRPI